MNRLVWPRDLCYVRYWRRNDDGSYGRFSLVMCFAFLFFFGVCNFPCFHCCLYAVVLFCSREHENCGPQPGFVRAHIESKSTEL